jgi:hypothetical protein
MRVEPGSEGHVADADGGRVRVSVRACARGGKRFTTASTALRAFRNPVPPLPQVIALTAHRRGHRVVVRWRTDRPARHTTFVATGLARHKPRAPIDEEFGSGDGRTRFRVTLTEKHGGRIRSVKLDTYDNKPPHDDSHARVRVR